MKIWIHEPEDTIDESVLRVEDVNGYAWHWSSSRGCFENGPALDAMSDTFIPARPFWTFVKDTLEESTDGSSQNA